MPNIITAYKQKRWTNIFVIYLRYLIGGAFALPAIQKINGVRFTGYNCERLPIDTFPHLLETLYRSGIYWEFLGWAQILAALLLMTQLFATLGALVFLPIILNIFFIAISYEPGVGLPIVAGLMLLANIFLLLWDYNKLIVLLIPDSDNDLKIKNQYNVVFNNSFWAYLGLIIFITTALFAIINGRNPGGWFLICVTEGLIGFIYMKRKYKKQTLS